MNKRLGMGIVGAGFAGPHHVEAVRRLGFVDVVALAASSQETADRRARALGIPRAFGDYRALLDDPAVQVVHIATPNHLHHPIALEAIARRRHVVCEKPLATTAADARALVEQAHRAGIVHAVVFNYRGNALVQQARTSIARGDIGTPHFLHGRYLQDWLLEETDYSWRLDPATGGASSALGDIGSHWCDLAEHVSGLRITEVLGDVRTVVAQRHRPRGGRDAFAGAHAEEATDLVRIAVDDLASVLLRFDNGAAGAFSVGQVCAGHKNDLVLEVCGSSGSIGWRQEQQNDLWTGHRHRPNGILQKDPALVDADARPYANLPGGHQEGWSDALANVMRDIYHCIAEERDPRGPHPPGMATFDDGCRASVIVESILKSAKAGSVWTRV